MQHRDSAPGFTLIELSIVIVIIGLIVGGVLVGRDLVQSAQVRATVAQLEKYKTALYTFRSKYNLVPGDMLESDAVSLGFQPTTRPGNPGQFVEHGNNTIDYARLAGTPSYCGNLQQNGEYFLFWQDLSSAGLIDHNFFNAPDGPLTVDAGTKPGDYFPAAVIDGNYWVGCSVILGASFPNKNYVAGNYFFLTGITYMGFGAWDDPPGITPVQANNIDAKIDDGLPNSGSIRASADTSLDPHFALGTCAYVQGAPSPTGVTNAYKTDTETDQKTCRISSPF